MKVSVVCCEVDVCYSSKIVIIVVVVMVQDITHTYNKYCNTQHYTKAHDGSVTSVVINIKCARDN